MDLGFRSDPNLHRVQSGPFRVWIEARQRGWRPPGLLESLVRSGQPSWFVTCNRKRQDCGILEEQFDAPEALQ